jgi:hypothetical protein
MLYHAEQSNHDKEILYCSVYSRCYAMTRLGKHFPSATNTHATIEERCFLCDPCREVIIGQLEQ